ncbi:hypothetical protein ACJX0J_040212, partial [Zea mays]
GLFFSARFSVKIAYGLLAFHAIDLFFLLLDYAYYTFLVENILSSGFFICFQKQSQTVFVGFISLICVYRYFYSHQQPDSIFLLLFELFYVWSHNNVYMFFVSDFFMGEDKFSQLDHNNNAHFLPHKIM